MGNEPADFLFHQHENTMSSCFPINIAAMNKKLDHVARGQKQDHYISIPHGN